MRKIAVTVLVLAAGTDQYSQIQEQPTQIKKNRKGKPLLSSVIFRKGEKNRVASVFIKEVQNDY